MPALRKLQAGGAGNPVAGVTVAKDLCEYLPALSASRNIARWIPALGWLRAYEPGWLQGDLVAGLTAAAVVVPQAMAYGAIAGLPLVAGLYTALVPLMVYAVMGTSRPLSVTTTSTIAILTGGGPAPGRAQRLKRDADRDSRDARVSGGRHPAVASVLRMGIVASFISEPVLIGFKAGVGLTIVVDQVPKLLGVHFPKGHFFHNLVSLRITCRKRPGRRFCSRWPCWRCSSGCSDSCRACPPRS